MAISYDDALTAAHNALIIAARIASNGEKPGAARLREMAGETGDMVDGFERPAPLFISVRGKVEDVPPYQRVSQSPHKHMGSALTGMRRILDRQARELGQ